ncbi:MAG: hypothetical protein ACLTXL_00760 [Clostridia bacterium]
MRKDGFQSTSPARGTTTCPPSALLESQVFNHVPARGTTTGSAMGGCFVFNPRPPQEGRPDSLEEAMEAADISIHVPRKRDDFSKSSIKMGKIISIHVPRKRDDSKNAQYQFHIIQYITTNQTIQPNTGSFFSPLSSQIYVFHRQISGANPPEKSRPLDIRTVPLPIDFHIHLPKTREVNVTSLVNVNYASIMDFTIETTFATVNPNSSKTVLAGPDAPK